MVSQLLSVAADSNDKRLPEFARACVAALGAQLRMLKAQILQFDRMITAWHRSNEGSRRLDDIPGVGPALATALIASIADPKAFRSGSDFPMFGAPVALFATANWVHIPFEEAKMRRQFGAAYDNYVARMRRWI
jgi:protein-S-isoprenylcysteine O-methyltransferase Ste14